MPIVENGLMPTLAFLEAIGALALFFQAAQDSLVIPETHTTIDFGSLDDGTSVRIEDRIIVR
jgi:hypothetical protein